MSTTVDNRVVSMQFNNSQFESGVATSVSSLNNLKKGLDLSESAKGLDSISTAASRVSFGGISSGLEDVRVKFSAMQVVAVTALANIATSALNTGKQLISSLTIDPISQGFQEYETQMNAIQTIMANTSSKGTSLDDVKSALAELNTYSDKTIYNFTEMSKNIGTFTAAGVDLKTSTAAIKGIANLAAVSGSSSEQASTAMYQLSQALASGKVGLQDWNSVVNAGMGGAVFQDSLKETAKSMGIAVDESMSFRDSISAKDGTSWLTSDVLLGTLEKFTGDLSESELAAKGYTESQIADIIKMGVTANDAATKVKTFTQLIDTLKEAVGSGWAQTWQTLFGDFEEAKVMFTSVSNVLGGMIGQASTARNALLTGWKDLGGRTVLIEAIKSAFDNVMSVVNALGSAFREIFPATTSAQLFSFTEGLKTLVDNFKLSDTSIANLKSTFKGVFAILDIGKTIFIAIANAVGIMVGGVGDLGSSILGVTGSFGEWLTALDKMIKDSDVFNKVLTTLAYGIKNGFSGIAYIFNIIVTAIGTVITAIGSKINFPGFEAVHAFLERLGTRMTSMGGYANSMSTTVSGAFTSMGTAITNSKMGELFTALWNTVKMVSSAVGTLVGKMADSITQGLKNANFNSILDGLAAMSIGGMLLAFKKFLTALSSTVGSSTGFLDNIKGVLDDVRGSFEAYQQNLKAGVLIKLGIAIALLAASIVAISMIDSDKLVSSLAAVGTLFAQLLAAMKVYSMIGEFKGKVLKAAVVMLAMSTSILILSSAMVKLSVLDWNGIAKGTVGIAALAGVLVASSKILSTGTQGIIKGSAGMVIFAVAIKMLAESCSELAKLSWDQLAKGLVGVGALLAGISVFLNTAKFSAKTITTAAGIVILAYGIKILASACADFGGMDWGAIVKGLESMGILLAEITIFTNVTGNAKNVISTGIALIAIGAAMKILASAMKDFGDMDWESVKIGLMAMGGALAEIAIAVNLMPKNLPVTAVGLILVGAALKIIASAMMDFGGMDWEEVKKGLIAMGGALTILSIGLLAMNGSLAGSAALLVAAAALAILAPTLAILGAMGWDAIVKGLTAIAGVFTILGVAGLLLGPLLPVILGLSGALVLLGVGMLGIGAGLALIGVGLTGLATGFTILAGVTTVGATAIVAALGIIILGVAALIPEVLALLGEGVLAFCKVLTDGMPALTDAAIAIVKAIVDVLVISYPLIIDGILKLLADVLASLIKWIPTISQQIVDILMALLKVISDNLGKFIQAGVDIVIAYVKGIADSIPTIVEAGFQMIISLINGITDSINTNTPQLVTAMDGLIRSLVNAGVAVLVGSVQTFLNCGTDVIGGLISGITGKDADATTSISDLVTNCYTKITSFVSDFTTAGENVIGGFVTGIKNKISDAADWAAKLAKSALDAAKEKLDINSPSREFRTLGEFSGEGFIIGMSNYIGKVADSGTALGTTAIDSMSNAISGISDLVNSEIDSQPVITPVMDLTDIQNGTNQLYSMMSDASSYSVNGAISTATTSAQAIQTTAKTSDTVSDGVTTSSSTSSASTSAAQPLTLQLMLQNGKAIAEFIVDDLDTLLGTKNIIAGRSVGV